MDGSCALNIATQNPSNLIGLVLFAAAASNNHAYRNINCPTILYNNINDNIGRGSATISSTIGHNATFIFSNKNVSRPHSCDEFVEPSINWIYHLPTNQN